MNRKGFILIETIVVMSVVMIALISVYGTYTSIVKNQRQRAYYDNINDVYRLNVIKTLVGDSFLSSNSFRSIDPSGCTYNSTCQGTITSLVEGGSNISIILIPSGFNPSDISTSYTYRNSLIRYLETTDYNKNKLIILRYEKMEKEEVKEYFASLEV